jgi:acyl dehydratase
MFWREVRANRDWYTVVPETGSYEYADRGHYERGAALEYGMPGPYDNPFQRTSFVAHLLTDWMGDLGFLRSVKLRFRRPFVFGDTMRVGGRVDRVDNASASEALVHVAIECQNQLGEVTTEGSATVMLPRAGRQNGETSA